MRGCAICEPRGDECGDRGVAEPLPDECLKAGAGGGGGAYAEPGISVAPLTGKVEHTGLTEIMPKKLVEQGPYVGMRDSLDPTAADPRYARLLQNVYPLNTRTGAAWVGRPGCVQADTTLAGRVQGFHQFTKLAGTEYTLVIAGGKLYSYDWATNAFTDLSSGQPTTSATARCYMVTFNDKVIASDGTNASWSWDGASYVTLSACPVLTGPLAVYYAKLFGIMASDPGTIVWSEEMDETIGYDSGGYNNAWGLKQTDQERLYMLLGTNDALFYWRARSMGGIVGAVNYDFASTGTREGLSETIGTKSPASVTYANGSVYFLDADMRPHVVSVGGRAVRPLYDGLSETLPSWDKSKFADQTGVYDPVTEMVLLSVTKTGDTYPGNYVVTDQRTDELAGLWTGFAHTAMGMVRDASGRPRIMHGTVAGNVYVHGLPDLSSPWNDVLAAADGGTAAISHIIKGSPMGYDIKGDKLFTRLDLAIRVRDPLTGMTLTGTTPRGTSAAQSLALAYPGSVWDDRHIAVGLSEHGRWHVPTLAHAAGTERFGFSGWAAEVFTVGPEPEVP